MSTKALTYSGLERLVRDVKNNVGLLDMPKGEILHLSAGGCTTASIAKSGGVVDISGNGNHGKSYGGFEIVTDGENGTCFLEKKCENSTDYILLPAIAIGKEEVTYHCRFKLNAALNNKDLRIFGRVINTSNIHIANANQCFWIDSANKLEFRLGNGSTYTIPYYNVQLEVDKWYCATATYSDNIIKIYINGVYTAGGTTSISNPITTTNNWKFMLGGYNTETNAQCLITDVRVYPYALTEKQVKSLYVLSKQPPALLSSNRIIETTDRTSAQINTLVGQVFA